MDIRFLSLKKIQLLQESIGFLDNYKLPKPKDDDGDTHIVGETVSYEDRDVEMTNLLKTLGQLNEKREEIIKKIMDKVV